MTEQEKFDLAQEISASVVIRLREYVVKSLLKLAVFGLSVYAGYRVVGAWVALFVFVFWIFQMWWEYLKVRKKLDEKEESAAARVGGNGESQQPDSVKEQ